MAETPRVERIQFSIIIPTYHRRNHLRVCLKAITAVDCPRSDFEVIVVDDGSGDPPQDVVDSFGSLISARLIVLPENRGPATARNVGALQARGTLLVFVDDDCVPDPAWLRELARQLDQQPRVLVGGGVRNGAPLNMPAEASHQLVGFLGTYYNADPTNAEWFTSANIACHRETFLAMGGFGPSFPLAAAEDRDFCDRWREAGNRLALAPEAVVHHARSMSLTQFVRQHYTYGRGAQYLHEARTRRGTISHRLEPLRFYWRLIFHPHAQRSGWRSPLLTVLLVLSQAAYAIGYYRERAQARRRAQSAGTAAKPAELQLAHERLSAPELIGVETRPL